MIRGVVTDMRMTVNVTLRLPGHPDFALECVIDTRFRGALVLPSEAVAALKLPYLYDIDANLADNSIQRMPLYVATVVWGSREILATVLAMGNHSLLGMALLRGHDLQVRLEEGGSILITPVGGIH